MESEKNQGNTTNLIGAGIEARLSVTGSSITSAYFLQKNAHGDVTAAISGTERVATYDYDAFGNTLIEEGEINNPIRYSGEYLDEESGLIYLRARYYDSSIGRFISEDPARDGMNWYAYCGNSPVMMVDPSGMFDYYTRIGYNQEYNEDVVALQNELVWLGYMDRPADDDWGYFGPATLDAVNRYKADAGLWNEGIDYGVVGLTTWKSLGLIYRTQDDINRGLEIALVGHAQYFDVTRMFNDQLWYAEQYLNEKWVGDRQITFYNKVNHNGDWDIKVRESWDRTFGGSYPGSATTPVILYGEFSTPEIMGNIMYAYLGRCIGFSEEILYWGGDYAAGGWNGIKNSADSPEDKAAIQKGFELYDRILLEICYC